MTLENPRVHAERGFPEYTTDFENAEARRGGVTTHSVFGHIVPDYTNLLRKGFTGILADVEDQRP